MNSRAIRSTPWKLGVFFCLLLVVFWGPSALAVQTDITSSVSITRSALVFNRATNTYDSRVTVTNTTGTTLLGPVQLVVVTTPVGVSLANGTGLTTDGDAYILVAQEEEQFPPRETRKGLLKFHNPQRLNFTATLAVRADLGTTVPDPGPAGRLTLEGVDVNGNGVRDDVEVYIEATVTDSARHQEALKSYAVAVQRALLSQSKSDAVLAGIAEVRAIQCLTYIGKRKERRWKDVLAHMLDTDERVRAFDAYNDFVSGETFVAPPDNQYRTACDFNVEATPD